MFGNSRNTFIICNPCILLVSFLLRDLWRYRIPDLYLQNKFLKLEQTISVPSYRRISLYFVNRQTNCMLTNEALGSLKKIWVISIIKTMKTTIWSWRNSQNKNSRFRARRQRFASGELKATQYHVVYLRIFKLHAKQSADLWVNILN